MYFICICLLAATVCMRLHCPNKNAEKNRRKCVCIVRFCHRFLSGEHRRQFSLSLNENKIIKCRKKIVIQIPGATVLMDIWCERQNIHLCSVAANKLAPHFLISWNGQTFSSCWLSAADKICHKKTNLSIWITKKENQWTKWIDTVKLVNIERKKKVIEPSDSE